MTVESYLPTFIRSRYALKLLGISLFIVLVITALATVTVVTVSDRVQDNQLQSVKTNAELEARALGQWIDGKQQVVRTLSNHDGVTPVDSNRTQATLETELESLSPETASLSIVERSPNTTSNGTTETIVASTETQFIGRPLSVTDVNWKPTVGFQFNDTEDVVLSLVYTDDNATFVALASPISNGDHVLIAEYRTSVRADQFSSSLSGTKTLVLGGFTSYVLFDENRSRGIRPYQGARTNTTIGRIIRNSDPTATIEGAVLTDQEVKGYHSVPGNKVDWVVVKEVPRSSALGLTDRIQRDLWLLVGIVLVGFLIIGVVIQRGPIRSIQQLARQANAIAEGDLSVDIESSERVDEVGEVRSAFSNTKTYIEAITDQAEALSNQAFDDDSLEADIPGRVGDSMTAMQRDLRQFITRTQVFNRVLRHNLRNRLDVINAHTEALDDTEHSEAIFEETAKLAALGTRARHIDTLMSKERQPTTVDIADRLEAVLLDIETDDVTLTTSISDDATVVTDAEILTTVLRSPLKNAVTYADSEVSVVVESTERGCTIEISDDGPGIPAAEIEPITAERETALEHSRGLGLWELKWGVDKLEGELSFATDNGTTITIQLPDLDLEC
jgi:methyl-accepting chemotaxis protein